MSIAPGVPVPADFGQARDAVDRHLGQVLAGRTLESVGWERPDPLTLYVPMRGFTTATTAVAYGFDPAADPASADRSFAGAPPATTTCCACTSATTRPGRRRPAS